MAWRRCRCSSPSAPPSAPMWARPPCEQQTQPEAQARTRDEARRYLAHASDLLKPRPPRLLAIGGLSGTGKSTVAYGLAPELGGVPGARVLRSDVIRKRLFGVALTDRLPSSAYGAEVGQRVFQRMREEAAAALAAGRSVVTDAVYARPAERDAIAAVAAKAQVPFVGLWLERARGGAGGPHRGAPRRRLRCDGGGASAAAGLRPRPHRLASYRCQRPSGCRHRRRPADLSARARRGARDRRREERTRPVECCVR